MTDEPIAEVRGRHDGIGGAVQAGVEAVKTEIKKLIADVEQVAAQLEQKAEAVVAEVETLAADGVAKAEELVAPEPVTQTAPEQPAATPPADAQQV